MRFNLLPILLLLTCHTTRASEIPQTGDTELNLSGSASRATGLRTSVVSATSAWLLDGGHQVGGGVEWGRTSTALDNSEHRGASVLYRYNWIAEDRSFFPYIGLAFIWSQTESSYNDTNTGFIVRTKDVNDAWQPHVGIKWMLNRHIAFDMRLTRRIERYQTPFSHDSTGLFTGLSLFL